MAKFFFIFNEKMMKILLCLEWKEEERERERDKNSEENGPLKLQVEDTQISMACILTKGKKHNQGKTN